MVVASQIRLFIFVVFSAYPLCAESFEAKSLDELKEAYLHLVPGAAPIGIPQPVGQPEWEDNRKLSDTDLERELYGRIFSEIDKTDSLDFRRELVELALSGLSSDYAPHHLNILARSKWLNKSDFSPEAVEFLVKYEPTNSGLANYCQTLGAAQAHAKVDYLIAVERKGPEFGTVWAAPRRGARLALASLNVEKYHQLALEEINEALNSDELNEDVPLDRLITDLAYIGTDEARDTLISIVKNESDVLPSDHGYYRPFLAAKALSRLDDQYPKYSYDLSEFMYVRLISNILAEQRGDLDAIKPVIRNERILRDELLWGEVTVSKPESKEVSEEFVEDSAPAIAHDEVNVNEDTGTVPMPIGIDERDNSRALVYLCLALLLILCSALYFVKKRK